MDRHHHMSECIHSPIPADMTDNCCSSGYFKKMHKFLTSCHACSSSIINSQQDQTQTEGGKGPTSPALVRWGITRRCSLMMPSPCRVHQPAELSEILAVDDKQHQLARPPHQATIKCTPPHQAALQYLMCITTGVGLCWTTCLLTLTLHIMGPHPTKLTYLSPLITQGTFLLCPRSPPSYWSYSGNL